MSVGHISVSDLNEALPRVLPMLLQHGKPVTAASVANARPTIEWPGLFVTEYTNPRKNVLFDAQRDANPFFHYLEAMWILAGRNDVQFLAEVLPKMADYTDDGEVFHGAYGFRLRHWPGQEGEVDQIEQAINILREAPDSRQVVMSIWDPAKDLGAVTKDMPCNDLIMLKVRDGNLRLTVANRSNDTVWGCYGANAVQFSMLLMYMAARLGVGVGSYFQVSDSFHVYEDNAYWQRFKEEYLSDPLAYMGRAEKSPYDAIGYANLFTEGIEYFDADLDRLFHNYDTINRLDPVPVLDINYKSKAVADAALLFNCLFAYKAKDYAMAARWLDRVTASDWQMACMQWLQRRLEKKGQAHA